MDPAKRWSARPRRAPFRGNGYLLGAVHGMQASIRCAPRAVYRRPLADPTQPIPRAANELLVGVLTPYTSRVPLPE